MPTAIQIRRLLPSDAGACAAIDGCSFVPAAVWDVADFGSFLEHACQGGYVASWQGRVIAYLLYHADRQGRRLYLVRITVPPAWCRRHVGSLLVQHVRRWLSPVPDVKLQAIVHERDLRTQCFLRANGFRAIEIGRGWYDDGANDGYRFEMGTSACPRPATESCS